MTIKGRVWKFGDDVNTDVIISGKYLENYDPAHLAAHAMEGVSRDFSRFVAKGDIIVAGRNFGCGSSREQAVIALKHAGVSIIIASSFARIFYRNSINLGLLVMISQGAYDRIPENEQAEVDVEKGVIVSERSKTEAVLEPVPEHLRRILDDGGLVPHIKIGLKNGPSKPSG